MVQQEQEDHEVQELEVKEVFQLESTVRRLSSIHDYKLSKKKILKNFNEYNLDSLILPGYNIVEKRTFRLNSLDLPYIASEDFRYRHSKKGRMEYGHMMNEIPFSELFDLRLKDYYASQIRG